MDTFNKILYLCPMANFCVWQTNDLNQYHGEHTPLELDGCLIDWNPSNTDSVPSQAQLDAVDIDLATTALQNNPKSTLFIAKVPTKEELIAQIAALTAQVNTLTS